MIKKRVLRMFLGHNSINNINENTALLVNNRIKEHELPDQRELKESFSNATKNDFKKLKYPKSVAFIISNEFCERFNYYGMRTVLVLYLTRRLGYTDDTATVLFHVFTSLVYFFPIFGAIVADSRLGRYKTILYLSVIYAIGGVIISTGSITLLNLPAKEVTIVGLFLMAVGTGGIKPCVSAFGGDQFKLPEQELQLAKFFSLFYFAINAGSLISTSVTPILREDVQCFNEPDCFPLAFGVPSILMVISILVFIFGKPLYQIKKPTGNMLVIVTKCITNAIKQRNQEKDSNPRDHWLDYSIPKYGQSIVNDVKALLKILVLYLPLPVFWALFDQQGSRWTFQATRMDGDVGFFTIKPDQMQVINPLLILVFIPLFDNFVYPLLAKMGIRRPLQKLTLGALLVAAAFIISACVEFKLETTYPVLPADNEAQLRIYNGMPCAYQISSNIEDESNFTVESGSLFEAKHIMVNNETMFKYSAIASGSSIENVTCDNTSGEFRLVPKHATSYFIGKGGELFEFKENPEKPAKGLPLLRILTASMAPHVIQFKSVDSDEDIRTVESNYSTAVEFPSGGYEIFVDGVGISTITIGNGGVYTVILDDYQSSKMVIKQHVITQPNTVHMLWLIPQYVVVTAAEVLFSVTGLEFSFTQAPESMKSVLQACWLLTVAFGNLIVVFVAEFRIFESQASEFLLFAGLMLVDLGIFVLLAMRYKYVENVGRKGSTIPAVDSLKSMSPISRRAMSGIESPDSNGDNTSKTNGSTTVGVDNKAFTGDQF